MAIDPTLVKSVARAYEYQNFVPAMDGVGLTDFGKNIAKRRELTRIKNALLNGKFYCKVNSVSRSGMSRDVTLAYIYKGRLRTINEKEILELATIRNNKIGGCGMDMLFHAQYSLFNSLFRTYKEAHYQKRMKAYNTIG